MSTRSLNKVMLIGNLTRDPELRYTPQGTAVCSFGLATNRSWTTEGGEKREEAEFHRIVSWNKLAELCSQLLVKGRKVFVEGRLQTRTWQGQDGNQRTTTEIVIDDMIILDSRRVGEETVPAGGVLPPESASLSAPAAPVDETGTPPTTDMANKPAAPTTTAASDDSGKKKKKTAATETATAEDTEAKQESTEGNEAINPDDIPF